MHDQFAALLATLVSFRSVDGQAEEKQKIVDFVAHWLDQNNVPVDRYPHPTAPSIIANLSGMGDPIVLLVHLDVVPAHDSMFTMKIEGDTCFGRGVIDDKGPAAIVMLLLASLASQAKRPAIRAVFTSDEEIGSRDGIVRLQAMHVLAKARCVIAIDNGNEDKVVVREKGVYHFILRAQGKTAHNAMPWEGDNAVEKVLRVIDRIKAALVPKETNDPHHWHETVSIGAIQGGEVVNQVPGSATAKIDIRFTENYSAHDIRAILDAQLEPGVGIEVIGTGEYFGTDPHDPLLALYLDAMRKQGMTMATVSEHGATDARFFADLGIPIWLHDPLGGGFHTDDEWLDLPSAVRVLEGLEEFCRMMTA